MLISQNPKKGQIILKNTGSAALYGLKPQISANNLKINYQKNEVPVLPPFGQETLEIQLKPKTLAISKKGQLTVKANQQTFTTEVAISFWLIEVLPPFLGMVACFLLLVYVKKKKDEKTSSLISH
jgi:hypothetical protein